MRGPTSQVNRAPNPKGWPVALHRLTPILQK
nr:MAG TPA: hypothetical protein [Caudoviricetes sp.]